MGRLRRCAMTPMDPKALDALVCQAGEEFKLTVAETRELRCVLAGYSCKEAAKAQGISPETVRQRRKVVYCKAQVHTDGQLTAVIVGTRQAWAWSDPGVRAPEVEAAERALDAAHPDEEA